MESMSISIRHILKESPGYKVRGTLWIEFDNERFFGPGRVELLENIERTGSISKAAKNMGMSYKKAWEMISALNKQAAMPLVLVRTGGEKGGGSVLTDEARELIKYHSFLRERFAEFLEKETVNLKQE
jgi:molybdate transport system regulatory protein